MANLEIDIGAFPHFRHLLLAIRPVYDQKVGLDRTVGLGLRQIQLVAA